MLGSKHNALAIAIVFAFALFCMGASCQTNDTLAQVRTAHSAVVAGFVAVDNQSAQVFEDRGDVCIERAEAAQLTGESAQEYARVCMQDAHMFELEVALRSARSMLQELEVIYNTIENRESLGQWQNIVRVLLVHGREIINILEQLDVDVPTDLVTSIETICTIINCEEQNENL